MSTLSNKIFNPVVKKVVVSFMIILAFVSCADNTKNKGTELTYLALGDSYTIGEGVAPGLPYPVQLKDSLQVLGFNLQGPKIIAKTGWTTTDLMKAIDTAILKPSYDLVTLLIGVNNQYRKMDIEVYREEFNILLKKSIEYAGNKSDHVIVISIPDWGVTPFASGRDQALIAQEIDQYNRMNAEMASQHGALYIDVTGISRDAATDPELIATDGLHPSGIMYKEWIEEMIPLAKHILIN